MADDFRMHAIIQELVRRANETTRRTRTIEQRMEASDIKQTSFEESVNERLDSLGKKLKEIESKTEDIGIEIIKLKSSLDKLNKQSEGFARRREVKEIERMFELLNPIRNEFVTRKALEEELRER